MTTKHKSNIYPWKLTKTESIPQAHRATAFHFLISNRLGRLATAAELALALVPSPDGPGKISISSDAITSHFTLLPTSTLPPVSPNSRALPLVSTQPAKRKLAICYWNFSFSAGVRERGNRKQKENKKTKNFASPDAREELWTLILTRWVSFLFSSKFKNRLFLPLQPQPSSLNRHHSYKTDDYRASIPTSGECAIDRVLRFSAESVQTHGATNLRSATFPFTLQFRLIPTTNSQSLSIGSTPSHASSPYVLIARRFGVFGFGRRQWKSVPSVVSWSIKISDSFERYLMRFVVSTFQGRDTVMHPERASGGGALSIWACKFFFSHPSLVIYIFLTPPIKLKLGLQKGRRLLRGNHRLVPIIKISQLESGISSQIIFITLFFGKCWALLCLSPASAANCAKMLGQNHFGKLNWHVLTALPFTSLCSNLCKNAGPKPFW